MLKIGITGGIGSGKSIVCTLFHKLGIPIYDSDSRAKELTNSDATIINGVKKLFGDEAYVDGEMQRKYVASKVFEDKSILTQLNKLIHPIVANDFKCWCAERSNEGAKYALMESAILIESGFDTLMDIVVCVTAPVDIRVERVLSRDGSTKDEIEKRINNQLSDEQRAAKSQYNIINDGKHLIMPQIVKLNSIFADESV